MHRVAPPWPNGWGEIRTREGCYTPHAFQAQHPGPDIHHPAVFQTTNRAICSISGPRMLDCA